MTEQRRAGRFETLGAWLGVWTPGRDLIVPPPPSPRTLALGGLGVVAVAVVIWLVVAPAVDEAKDRSSSAQAREAAQQRAARQAAAREEQRVQRGSAARPAGALSPVAERAARRSLVGAMEAHILRDVRERFDSDADRTTCAPFPRSTEPRDGREILSMRRGTYECLAVEAEVDDGRGRIGVPYRAIVDFPEGEWLFCKINPVPSEQVIPDPRALVGLPRACRP